MVIIKFELILLYLIKPECWKGYGLISVIRVAARMLEKVDSGNLSFPEYISWVFKSLFGYY
jgi:hypothetical protein